MSASFPATFPQNSQLLEREMARSPILSVQFRSPPTMILGLRSRHDAQTDSIQRRMFRQMAVHGLGLALEGLNNWSALGGKCRLKATNG